MQSKESISYFKNNHSKTTSNINQLTDSHNEGHEPDLSKLVDKLNQSYQKSVFTHKFIDPLIEAEYVQKHHEDVKEFTQLYLLEILTSFVIYFCFQIFKLCTQEDYPSFPRVIISVTFYILFPSIHIVLTRYSLQASMLFAPVQILACLITFSEMMFNGNDDVADVDGFISIMMLIMTLSFISYSQVQILISYVACVIFNLGRTVTVFDGDTFRYLRYNSFFAFCFCVLYAFSRRFSSRERLRFEKERNTQLLLRMFHNLLRVFHDGIIICEKEQIIYQNKQIFQIFSLDGKPSKNSLNLDLQLQKINRDNEIIEAFKNSYPKVDTQNNQLSLQTVNDDIFGYDNMWEFIQMQQKHYNRSIHGLESFKNPLDGMYFKFKTNLQDSSSSKRLQVFTQVAPFGRSNVMMATVRDMSYWLELEKQRSISQMKTITFAEAAHEFRNPLNGIIASLDLLESQMPFQHKSRIYFNNAKNCSKLMLFLVNDILDFAQFEQRKLLLNKESFLISDIFEQCVSVLNFQAEAKQIQIISEIDPKLYGLKIVTDQNRLRQILINLLSNGIKYTRKGFVKLYAGLNEYQNVIFQIVDSGVGIAPEKILHLFSVFTKIHENREMNKQGCGLGLTISKNLANALGGDITVTSEQGKGSTFTLEFKSMEMFQASTILPGRASDASQSFSFEKKSGATHGPPKLMNQEKRLLSKIGSPPSQMGKVQSEEEFDDFDSYRSNGDQSLKKLRGSDPGVEYLQTQRSRKMLSNKHLDYVHKQQRSAKIHQDQVKISVNEVEFEEIKEQSCCRQILVADDEPFNIISIEGILECFKLDIDKAYDGQAVLDQLEVDMRKTCGCPQYKLLILDNTMPNKSGIQVAFEIRQGQRDGIYSSEYRLALLTGENEHDIERMIIEQCQDQENLFDLILQKPINIDRLRSLLQFFEVI